MAIIEHEGGSKMNTDSIQKALILSQALPYIQKYNNKIVVIKYGGNAMINEEMKHNVMSDIVLLSLIGIHVVLVHGGGPDINNTLKKMHLESKFIDGLRYSDKSTIDVVQMVLTGKTNKDLVKLIGQKGAKAIGLSGIDAGMIHAKKYLHEPDLGYVGEIIDIDENVILDVIEKGYIPVIASVGIDNEGHTFNINADNAAASIAAKLASENLILVSDVPGVLKDPKDESSILSKIECDQVQHYIDEGIIKGGMIPKVNCCLHALQHTVKKAVIIDGKVPHSILIEMFSDDGIGTMFVRKEKRENECISE